MAKRFTDSNKYKDQFLRGLQGAYKLLWDYIKHDCDHAGIWIVDFEIAQIYLGSDMQVNKSDALKYFNGDEQRIIIIGDDKKWFIPSFIEEQYGKLNPQNKVHNSVLTILEKHKIMGYPSPLNGAKEKDKAKDKEKEKKQNKKVIVLESLKSGIINIGTYLLEFPEPELKKDAIEVIKFMRKTKNPKSKLEPDQTEIGLLIQNWLTGGTSKDDLMKMIRGAGSNDFETNLLQVSYIIKPEHRARLLGMEEKLRPQKEESTDESGFRYPKNYGHEIDI